MLTLLLKSIHIYKFNYIKSIQYYILTNKLFLYHFKHINQPFYIDFHSLKIAYISDKVKLTQNLFYRINKYYWN